MKKAGWQAVIAGVGGQGVLFTTRLLAMSVAGPKDKVLISEVHGMAQRGGAVVSHLKVGDFSGPLVRQGQADLLLSLDPGEAVRNLNFLRPGGAMLVNAPGPEFLSQTALDALDAQDITCIFFNASGAALKMGAPKGVNVMMAAAAGAMGVLPVGQEQVKKTLEEITPPARQKANLALFQAGVSLD